MNECSKLSKRKVKKKKKKKPKKRKRWKNRDNDRLEIIPKTSFQSCKEKWYQYKPLVVDENKRINTKKKQKKKTDWI